MAESSRGTSPTRPAEVREVSRTSTTRRSRSGCQVRTTTVRVRALARQSIGAQLEHVLAHVKGAEGSSAELLRFVIATLGGFVGTSDRVVLAKVLLAEAGNFPELAEFWRREIVDRGVTLFETIIRRGIARGEFRDVVPAHAARLCIAPVLVTILWRTVFAQFDETPYDYRGLIDTHLDTLLRGLAVPGGGT